MTSILEVLIAYLIGEEPFYLKIAMSYLLVKITSILECGLQNLEIYWFFYPEVDAYNHAIFCYIYIYIKSIYFCT